MTRTLLRLLVVATILGAAAGPSLAQPGVSPVTVETLDIEPTVVKTGDTITQTYRVRFPDLIDQGREIIILEDRMTPENLPVHPFEGVSLDIRKRRVEDEHVWDFVYGLRLIAPEKALYVLPGFSFYYLVRDLGEDIEDAEVQQIDGGGGLVRYVTTITDLPVLDIRDTLELGSFAGRATVFNSLAWGLAPLPLLVWFVLLVRHTRRPRTVTLEQQKEEDELARIEAQIPVPPSIWQARRTVTGHIEALGRLPRDATDAARRDVQMVLVISLREYLQAELTELHKGDTAKDIVTHVGAMKDGGRKRALHELASRLLSYQSGLETGQPAALPDPRAEAHALSRAVTDLRPHNRLMQTIKSMFGG